MGIQVIVLNLYQEPLHVCTSGVISERLRLGWGGAYYLPGWELSLFLQDKVPNNKMLQKQIFSIK